MTDHDKIVAAVKEALRAERDEFWIPQPKHYLDHQLITQCQAQREEWAKNHEFVSSVRAGASVGKKVSIGIASSAVLCFIAGAIWLAIKNAVKGG